MVPCGDALGNSFAFADSSFAFAVSPPSRPFSFPTRASCSRSLAFARAASILNSSSSYALASSFCSHFLSAPLASLLTLSGSEHTSHHVSLSPHVIPRVAPRSPKCFKIAARRHLLPSRAYASTSPPRAPSLRSASSSAEPTYMAHCATSPSRPARPLSWYSPSSVAGGPQCATHRTFGLSTPMPNATVATTASMSPADQHRCARARHSGGFPAWYETQSIPDSERTFARRSHSSLVRANTMPTGPPASSLF
mmetsp:Transcript_13900/g.52090  ORF Transcript_13900/g.52090 Transcript_13900/m.52090 type:complete len:252 (-) Transcript_13900:1089-1844(-)